MMQHCLDGDSKFGVVLIKSGSEVGGPAISHPIGTVANIVKVDHAEGGRAFLSVTGEQRFLIKEITQYRPYMEAQVELLEDDVDSWVPPTETEAIRLAITQHIRMVLGLRGGWVLKPSLPSDPAALSYFIGGLLQVGLPEKQTLLEASTASRRLETELDLLRREFEDLNRRVAREMRQRFSRQ